jgi:hypothetical protein
MSQPLPQYRRAAVHASTAVAVIARSAGPETRLHTALSQDSVLATQRGAHLLLKKSGKQRAVEDVLTAEWKAASFGLSVTTQLRAQHHGSSPFVIG